MIVRRRVIDPLREMRSSGLNSSRFLSESISCANRPRWRGVVWRFFRSATRIFFFFAMLAIVVVIQPVGRIVLVRSLVGRVSVGALGLAWSRGATALRSGPS